ncbi:MAG: hypothetical protein OHK0022_29790 [Roseiflexaceae bacterium]
MAFFSTTALGPGSPLFRGRAAELARLQQLCQEEVTRYGVVYGGRQNGKTSLLFQLQASIQPPMRVCRIDFQQIQGAPPERVFALLAEQIDAVVPLGTAPASITSAPQLKQRLHEALARPEVSRLILLLDELGALPLESRRALGLALRSFFHDRLVYPPLGKLLVIFTGGVELYTLVVSEASSLHNICEEIYLPDLREVDAVALVANGLRAAGVDANLSITLAQAVYAQVEGHPYLTQRMGELLAAAHASGQALNLADVDRAATTLRDSAPPLLRGIRSDLREHRLEEAARRLLSDPPPFDRLDDDMAQLELIGLAKQIGKRWGVRNLLLALVFRRLLSLTVTMPKPALPPGVPVLVKVPAGPFLMGSNDTDTLADRDEKPEHRFVLPDFWIGQTPVTNAQFRPFVEGDGYTNRTYWTSAGWEWRQQEVITQPAYWTDSKWNGADYPIVGISWFEAVAYCRWLTVHTGLPFRLPTEAEWEKAARGPEGRIWPWGNRWEAGRCNSQEAGTGRTTPVGQYPSGASYYGALDMAGNVWEWCSTQGFDLYPYPLQDEWAEAYLEVNKPRIFRGGSCYDNQKNVRGASHINVTPRDRNLSLGLRVASHSPRPDAVF